MQNYESAISLLQLGGNCDQCTFLRQNRIAPKGQTLSHADTSQNLHNPMDISAEDTISQQTPNLDSLRLHSAGACTSVPPLGFSL